MTHHDLCHHESSPLLMIPLAESPGVGFRQDSYSAGKFISTSAN